MTTYVPSQTYEIQLTVSPHSIDSLPRGAVYTARDGPAQLQVGRDEKGNIHVTARVDSTARRVETTEENITQLEERKDTLIHRKDSASVRKEVPQVQPFNRFKTGLKWYIIGVISGAVMAYIVKVLITKKII